MTRALLALLVAASAGCSGLLPPPTHRYVVDEHVVDAETGTVYWYEHHSGPDVGSVPGDEVVHVVMCNERVVPPCGRVPIETFEGANARVWMERFAAARGGGGVVPVPETDAERAARERSALDEWSHE